MAAVTVHHWGLWDGVLELTKTAQDPMLWTVQLSSSLNAAVVPLPSTEVTELLVSLICWENNVPIMWKFLEKAPAMKIELPMLILALLSSRVIASRQSHPAAHRLYMDLLKRHAFSFASQIKNSNYEKSSHWRCFIQHLQLLAAMSSALRNSKNITSDALLQLTSDKCRVLSRECKTSLQKQFHAVIAGSLVSSAGQCHGTSQSALWLPFDLFLEDSMDGSHVTATSAVEILTGAFSCTFMPI